MIEAMTVFFMPSSYYPLSFSFITTSTRVSSFLLSCLLCLMSFPVIPRLLRYSLRLRARSHNFSGELWSALLVFPTHFPLCPSLPLWRASVQYYCSSNTVVFDFLLQQTTTFIEQFYFSKIYLYIMGYVFGSA